MEIIKGYAQNKIFLIVLAVVILAYVFTWISKNKAKGNAKDFLANHPNAGGICVKNTNLLLFFIYSKIIGITGFKSANNDQQVHMLRESGYTVYYFLPGEYQLSVNCRIRRPGIIYRNVTTTYDADITVAIDEKKKYELTFDKKTKSFGITPMN